VAVSTAEGWRPPDPASEFTRKYAVIAVAYGLQGTGPGMPPLLIICASWLAGLVLGSLAMPIAGRAWVALATLGTAIWLTNRLLTTRVGWLASPALGLLAAAAGVATTPDHGHRIERPGLRRGLAVVEARVIDVRHGEQGARSRVEVTGGHYLSDHTPVPPGLRVSVAPHPLPSAARVRLLVAMRPVTPYRNPSPHPAWPSAQRVEALGRLASSGAIEVHAQPGWARLLDATRSDVRSALQRTLSAQHVGLARALVLGEGSAVRETDRDAIRRAGLAHVLAVSGLHVAVVAGLLVSLLRLALLLAPIAARSDARRVACALGVPLALALSMFAGGSPSALRAGVTAALGWCVIAAGRRPAPVQVAAAAVLLVTASAPALAMRPGMLLSIAATAAIVSTGGDGVVSGLRQLATMSTRTLLATAPMVLWCFGAVALPGLAANVVLLPVASALLIPLAATHATLASLAPLAASWSAPAFALVADAFVAGCARFAELGSDHPWPPPSIAQGLALCLWTAAVLLLRSVRARVLVTLATVLVMGAAEYWLVREEQPRGVLRVTFVDVGQGDAALVDLPDGRLMLIDAGGVIGGGRDPGEHALLPLLRARRRDRIDIAVLSHPHPDHYGGLRALLRHVDVGELWDSGQAEQEVELSPTASEATDLLREARGRGTHVRDPGGLCERPLVAGGARVQLLWPCPGYDSGLDANDNSLVLRIEFGGRSVLFSGDIEGEAETALVEQRAALGADILKVAHHGSRTSSSDAFLAAVRPRLAVISAGAHNRFQHPHAEVVQRLHAHGAHVVELAREGGTVVTIDGPSLTAVTWSGRRWSDARGERDSVRAANQRLPRDEVDAETERQHATAE